MYNLLVVKHAILLIIPFWCSLLYAQEMPIDTLPDKDSIVEDIGNEIRSSIPTILMSDDDADEGTSSVVSSILSAGRDPFISAAEFNFSLLRFRLRGYETGGTAVFINGINFNGLDNGFTTFGLWGGLNNVMRFQQDVYGLAATDFDFGNLGLNTNVDMRAGTQRTQTQIGYANSNRNYNHRITLYHGVGFNKNGWAYCLAFTGRYAYEGYVPGTYYRGFSYYAALDKKLKNNHRLSLITFGAPTKTGRQGASVQETMDLVGSNYYNPSWGYQNGQKRNANVLSSFQPVFLLTHEHIGFKSRWNTSIAYMFGKKANSALDWYNTPDPRPDYYRYLPSYYQETNPVLAKRLSDLYKTNPAELQVDWDNFYSVNEKNTATITNANGISGNTENGARSLYILSDRINDQKRIAASTVLNIKVNDKIALIAGANFQQQINHYYQQVKDLLGGDFWVNINQFAERDFPNNPDAVQYDLDHPNRIIKVGDKYGFNYRINMLNTNVWAQTIFTLKHFDLFFSGRLGYSTFFRSGLNKNGLFPEVSYGKSVVQSFINPSAKAGITYKLNGRNYFLLNGAYVTNPPFAENAFISQRTRNTLQDNLINEGILSAEAGYKLITPKIKFSATVYYTSIVNGVDVLTFYHDQYQNFVNYALSGIDKIFFGVEAGAEIKLTPTLSFSGAASLGRYYYNSRQHALVTVDNSAKVLAKQTIYLKNYRIPSTPQNAYSGGFFYRSPKYWYISFTTNYFDNMWLSPNPLRRTADAIADADPENPFVKEIKDAIIQQQKFDAVFSVDFFGGWSKLLPKKFYINHRRTYLVLNVGVNNLLNNRRIHSGGYEQLRFDFEDKKVDKFPPKYYYAYGINYFAGIALRF